MAGCGYDANIFQIKNKKNSSELCILIELKEIKLVEKLEIHKIRTGDIFSYVENYPS